MKTPKNRLTVATRRTTTPAIRDFPTIFLFMKIIKPPSSDLQLRWVKFHPHIFFFPPTIFKFSHLWYAVMFHRLIKREKHQAEEPTRSWMSISCNGKVLKMSGLSHWVRHPCFSGVSSLSYCVYWTCAAFPLGASRKKITDNKIRKNNSYCNFLLSWYDPVIEDVLQKLNCWITSSHKSEVVTV